MTDKPKSHDQFWPIVQYVRIFYSEQKLFIKSILSCCSVYYNHVLL